jgi:hypothetical protein
MAKRKVVLLVLDKQKSMLKNEIQNNTIFIHHIIKSRKIPTIFNNFYGSLCMPFWTFNYKNDIYAKFSPLLLFFKDLHITFENCQKNEK